MSKLTSIPFAVTYLVDLDAIMISSGSGTIAATSPIFVPERFSQIEIMENKNTKYIYFI